MSALAPVITKKLKSNAVTVGSLGGKMEFVVDCSTWGDDCVFCTEDKCSLCAKDCNDNEFVFTQDCICKNWSEVDANCVQCTAKKCKKCRAGYGLANYRCEQCSAGTYSDGTTECLKAPIGYYVASAGQGSATPCGAGTYQNEEGKTSCKTCSAGTYQNETGKTSCKTCEIDYMCTGGNNRTQCAANYGANAGSSSCSPCPSYCADCQVPNVCLRCNAGFYLSNNTCYPCTVGYSCDGSVNQTVCPAGYYSGAGASSCSACAAGTYSGGGVQSCSACAAGSYSGAGASSCTACSTTWAHCTACSADGCSACENGYVPEDNICKVKELGYGYTGTHSQNKYEGKQVIFLKSTGVFTPYSNASCVLHVIGSGGGGGSGNGQGGFPGAITSTDFTLYANSNYNVTIGTGGNGGSNDGRGTSGGSSGFAQYTAAGGTGGCGNCSNGKNGNAGTFIAGSYYAGGGASCCTPNLGEGYTFLGGAGGGGGSTNGGGHNGGDGQANTGGGGGGGSWNYARGGKGGSGIVILIINN